MTTRLEFMSADLAAIDAIAYDLKSNGFDVTISERRKTHTTTLTLDAEQVFDALLNALQRDNLAYKLRKIRDHTCFNEWADRELLAGLLQSIKRICDDERRSSSAQPSEPKCPDGLLPDGATCPRCGNPRAASGIDGGTWVHFPCSSLPQTGERP